MLDWQTVVTVLSESSPQAVMTAAVLWAFVVMFRKFVIGDPRWSEKPAAERLREVNDGGPQPTLSELLARLLRLDEKIDGIAQRVERLERWLETGAVEGGA